MNFFTGADYIICMVMLINNNLFENGLEYTYQGKWSKEVNYVKYVAQ